MKVFACIPKLYKTAGYDALLLRYHTLKQSPNSTKPEGYDALLLRYNALKQQVFWIPREVLD